MRLLIIVMTLLLFVAILGFILDNIATRVDLKILGAQQPDVALYLIVIVAILVGICYSGVIAVAEGAHIRISNRRMSRAIQKLETELNYLRTQPPTRSNGEPDSLPEGGTRSGTSGGGARSTEDPDHVPPSAPVYGNGSADSTSDEDDDFYTGGRAV